MTADFLGFRFAPLTIGDRPRIEGLLARDPQPLSDYGFASLVVWAPVHGHRFTIEADTLLVTSELCHVGAVSLLQPVGEFPPALRERLLDRARAAAAPLRICSVSGRFLERYPEFVASFAVAESRDNANYVYAATDLAELRGKRYSKQRNRISRATADVDWSVEPLDVGHVDECRLVADDIASKRTPEECVTLDQENLALDRALELFGPLRLRGLLLRLEGRPAAFAIHERLGPTTAVVLFERALRAWKGAYQVINRETARALVAEGIVLVNREEDLGDPGLRRAKLSYGPERLERKYTLAFRA